MFLNHGFMTHSCVTSFFLVCHQMIPSLYRFLNTNLLFSCYKIELIPYLSIFWISRHFFLNVCRHIEKVEKHCFKPHPDPLNFYFQGIIFIVLVIRAVFLSSDEFRIWLKIIQNSTENVEFEFQIRGRISSLNSNSTKFDSQICLLVGLKIWI